MSALGGHALRVVRAVIGQPFEMLEKLDARYDSRTTALKISNMSELVSVRYSSLKEDMSKHIDSVAALLEQPRNMGTVLSDDFAIGILVASIDVHDLRPATAAIKTLAEHEINWEDVTTRLIEEVRELKNDNGRSNRALAANPGCVICSKLSHRTDACFLNPLNPRNKLNLRSGTVSTVLAPNAHVSISKGSGKNTKSSKGGRNVSVSRAAMAKHNAVRGSSGKIDRLMLDSGTTSNMTAMAEKVHSKTGCNVSITLADNSALNASKKGTRTVQWYSDSGPQRVHLSQTLVTPEMAMSLLSVPALVRKNIGVLLIPQKALLIDLEEKFLILCQALQDTHGLFYISDYEVARPVASSDAEKQIVLEMMAISRHHVKYAVGKSIKEGNDECAKDIATSCAEENVTAPHFSMEKVAVGQAICRTDLATLWHLRLGHAIPLKAVSSSFDSGILPRVVCSSIDCENCAKGKYRKRFSGTLTSAARIGPWHADTKGKLTRNPLTVISTFLASWKNTRGSLLYILFRPRVKPLTCCFASSSASKSGRDTS